MFKQVLNIFRVPELRNKVLFTLLMLAIYRIGWHVPLFGSDLNQFIQMQQRQASGTDNSAAGALASYVSLFSAGNLSQSSIFGLGVMPYISSSIIFQLLGTVMPSIEKLQKEGETGRKKIQEWSRYITVPLCLIQASFWISYMNSQQLVLPQWRNTGMFWIIGLMSLTAGSIFLMWLGEQIDEYGLGNGVSVLILAGIIARMPSAIFELNKRVTLSGDVTGTKDITPAKLLFVAACFAFVVAGSILITQAQRRIPIQQAKHTRGRMVYGGQKQWMPLRVNHGGVMPIIFAQSLMLFPTMGLKMLSDYANSLVHDAPGHPVAHPLINAIGWLEGEFSRGNYFYFIVEAALIYFFAYFWTTVQFQPKEMANQLRDYGTFIPGLRPGKRTADYLEKVMMRITYVGAAFLCVIAVVPMSVQANLNIPQQISAFLGGTGLLIVVEVALDIISRIEANLLMRDYGGFLGGGSGSSRIRSPYAR
jgi:preprotein translocase subunit SecY